MGIIQVFLVKETLITYTKFGTVESIIKTAYNAVDKYEILADFWQNYFISLFSKESINNIFNVNN